jgi:hypothetical protein
VVYDSNGRSLGWSDGDVSLDMKDSLPSRKTQITAYETAAALQAIITHKEILQGQPMLVAAIGYGPLVMRNVIWQRDIVKKWILVEKCLIME